MQGNLDKLPALLARGGDKEEKEKLVDAKPSCSSKSDSGISLQDKDTSKPPSQRQSGEYIHLSVETPGSENKQFHAVLNKDTGIHIVGDKEYKKSKLLSSREQLAHCNLDLPLIVDQEDLEKFMNKEETDI